MKTIYFVRHGQTHSNLERRVGSTNDPLTKLGEEQAQLIADRLKGNISVEAILCSPYKRAMQTVEPIAAALGCEVEYSNLLIESKRPSLIEGKSMKDPEMRKVNELVHANWGNPNWHHSDEENFFDLSKRVRAALAMIAARPEESLLVVTHGAFMNMVLELVLLGDLLTPELSTSMYFSLHLSNTGVTVLTYTDEGKWVLERWNDTVHLEPGTQLS